MSDEEQVYDGGAEVSALEIARFEDLADEIAADVADVGMEEEDEIKAAGASSASAYKVVNLIGRFCSPYGNWGTQTKDFGTVQHWNGPPTPARAWQDPIAWIKLINDLHAEEGRFSPGWRFDGVAYHEFVFNDTVYRTREYGANLPHCGNLEWNHRALGLHVAIGEGQRANAATLKTLAARHADHLAAMGLGRSQCKGHREVGSSECPGSLQGDFVLPFRAGKTAPSPTPPVKAPVELVYNIAASMPDKKLADAATAALKKSGIEAYTMNTPADILQASQKALNESVRPALVIGGPVVGRLHADARKAFSAGQSRDRLMDCVGTSLKNSEDKIAWRLVDIANRAGKDKERLVGDYRARLPKGSPIEPTPTKPPKKTYAAADFAVLNGFRMWPAVARDCARIANEFGLTPAVFSTYSNNQGRHGDAPPGGSVDILISDRYGKWANERQLAFGKGIVRWLYGEYDSGRMGLDYVVFAKVYNHFNGIGDQPYDPNWSLGKNPVSDDHGDHIHITWLV